MKVAILHPAFGSVGGAEVVAVNHARCLKESGFDVRIVTGFVNRARWSEPLEGIPIELLEADSWLDGLRGRDTWMAQPNRGLDRIVSQVDVAIAENYPISRALALADAPVRKLWYCHEPNRKIHLQAANPTIARRVERGTVTNTDAERFFLGRARSQRSWIPGRASRFVAEGRRDAATVGAFERIWVNSHFGAELATRAYGDRPYSVLYPLMRLPERRTTRSGINRNELQILVHSRLEAPKNVDTIIRGFAKFAQHHSKGAILHVVGEGRSRDMLERLARELAIGARVRFHGFLPTLALRAIYDSCEVFALLPTDEPFGMVFPEAIAQGLLVVGPDHGGPFEILERGRIGVTCDAFSAEGLASALERVASMTDGEADSMRADAEASCRNRFSWQVIASQLVASLALC